MIVLSLVQSGGTNPSVAAKIRRTVAKDCCEWI